ncbi:MAG: Ig-like domain-containing protein [Lachnospiraceae bacterium]|nr:Ig-like domain-containing protein [Lachnospiraceae bacterium]
MAYKLVNGKKITIAKSITAHIVGRLNTKFTNAKDIKILSKTELTLKKKTTSVIKAQTILVAPKKKQIADTYATEFRYASSNNKVATVDKTGKITAVKKGTCIIYVYSRNGYTKKINVTVK